MRRIIVNLCMIMLLLTACNSKQVAQQMEEKNPETDFQTEYYDLSLNAHPMVEVDNGYYMLIGSYIYYIDKETMEYTPLCNKPNCLHQKEKDEMKVANCNAMIQLSNLCCCLNYYKEHLYIVSLEQVWTEGIVEEKYFMNKLPLDGGEREIIYEFQKPIDIAIVHRGYIYYSSNVARLGSEAAGVYRVPLEGGEEETIYISENNKNQLSYLKIIENELVFTEYSEDEGKEHCLWRYDLAKEKIQKISCGEGIDVFWASVAGDRIYYSCQEKESGKEITMSTNLDWSDWKEEEIFSNYQDEDYYYEDDWDNHTQIVYDRKNKKEVTEFHRWPGMGAFFPGKERLIWIEYENDQGMSCFYIDRKDIAKGDSAVKTLIKLSGDEANPGVVIMKE